MAQRVQPHHEALGSTPSINQLWWSMPIIISVLGEAEAGGSEVQSHPEVGSKSRGSLDYMRSYLKKRKDKNRFKK